MSNVIFKFITLGVLIIVGMGGLCQADTKTEAKDKVESVKKKASAKKDELPVLKLEVDKSSKSNPKLKQGKGCENLEELEGETFDDYPMAETVPCDKVDCKDLEPAKLEDDNFKELPTAKTEGSCEEE
jgi:Na+-transporting methylmalonyl-CoA/oxaloacetate decarboxylase gamma subunit